MTPPPASPVPASATPAISVIVPVYNVAAHVAACLTSILRQNFTDFELIVVDDGSTDGSGDIAAATLAGDTRARVIRQANGGLSAARNAGLDVARGRTIAFVDSDDRVMPDYLARLYSTLQDSQSDWVACAMTSVMPDGTGHMHSAIHGAQALTDTPVPRRFALTRWSDVIRHFPSAWNKLYRAELIADLRFDTGTWFEDHTFFLRAAARTDHLMYLPEALYLQTRGRDGQITAADDDRVFEQFAVLDSIRTLLDDAVLPGGADAFQQLASRLVFERATVLHDPDRRARFAAETITRFAGWTIPYTGDWPSGVGQAWGLELAGHCPLSLLIRVPRDTDAGLRATLDSISAQLAHGFELHLLCPDAATAQTATQMARAIPRTRVHTGLSYSAALAQAQGRFVMALTAGDVLAPLALHETLEEMLHSDADLACLGYRHGANADPHSGWLDDHTFPHGPPPTGPIEVTPDIALAMAPSLSAKMLKRSFVLEQGLTLPETPAAEALFTLQAALTARQVVHICWSAVTLPPTRQGQPPSPLRPAGGLVPQMRRALRHLPPPIRDHLPAGWEKRLYGRLVRDQIDAYPPQGLTQLAPFAVGVGLGALRLGVAGSKSLPAGQDAAVGPRIAQLLDPARVLRPNRPAAIAPSDTDPTDRAQNDADTGSIPAPRITRTTLFDSAGTGLVRLRAEFHHHAYANLSFLGSTRHPTPLHVSLRYKEQQLVVNDRRSDTAWRAERIIPLTLSFG